MKYFPVYLLLVLLPTLPACQDELFLTEPEATPTLVFRKIYQDFKDHYGLFGVKAVDWDSLYTALDSQVHDRMTERELYDVTVRLLSPLRDRHVTLYPASSASLPRWSTDLTEDGAYVVRDFDFGVVREHYLTDLHEPVPFVQYGWVAEGVGYLHIQHMDGRMKNYESALDAAAGYLSDAEGLILDIRDNSGGFDPIAQYVAGRLAATEAPYMVVRKKNGPGPTDFTQPQEWWVRPAGDRQLTPPTIVLTSDATASAAETFLLALRTQAHVRQFGTTTSGSFSDAPMWEAPNGWTYTLSVGDYRDPDGVSYEGIGLVPEVTVQNSREDLLGGKDTVLERAIAALR